MILSKLKIIFITLFQISILTVYSQVGINNADPKALLHIDPPSNAASGGNSNNYSKSIIINSEGNVGVGTTEATNRLTIESASNEEDLHLPNGSKSGFVLRSKDREGNSYWTDGPLIFYTVMIGQGSRVTIPRSASTPKLTQFTLTGYDNVKDIFGDEYGWDVTKQQYVVPRNGRYRISFSIYINSGTNANTTPILGYIFKNGQIAYDPGFITIAYNGGEAKGFLSGFAELKRGDIIDFRIYSATNNNIVIWAQWGHTFIVIESL